MSLKVGDTFNVTIESLTFNGGRGLARVSGCVVFIPFCAPGELVKIIITKAKKSFAEGQILEILNPSERRITPKCPVYGQCGGCCLQHIDYSAQLDVKKNILENFIRPVDPTISIPALKKSPNIWNYRNRIQLHYDKKKVGFYSRNSNEIIPITHCPIADEKLNLKIKQLSDNKFKDFSSKKKLRFELACTQDHQVILSMGQFHSNTRLFSQVNQGVNKTLIDKCLHLAQEINPTCIIDLYSGNGNFCLAFKERFQNTEVLGVELSSGNVRQCLLAAKSLKLDLQMTQSSVEDYLKTLPRLREGDLVLVDPPRTGLSTDVKDQLLRLKPKNLIYVSCDPATLARDLKSFYKNHTYQITDLSAFDMFPQTDHFETLVVLSRVE